MYIIFLEVCIYLANKIRDNELISFTNDLQTINLQLKTYISSSNYHKVPKFSYARNFCCNLPKI